MYKVKRKYRQTRQIFELKFIYFEFWHLWYVVFEGVQRSELAQGGIGQHHYRLVSQLRRKRIDPRTGKRCQKTSVSCKSGRASLIQDQVMSFSPSAGIHLDHTARIQGNPLTYGLCDPCLVFHKKHQNHTL